MSSLTKCVGEREATGNSRNKESEGRSVGTGCGRQKSNPAAIDSGGSPFIFPAFSFPHA
jgi:hypothetical protein